MAKEGKILSQKHENCTIKKSSSRVFPGWIVRSCEAHPLEKPRLHMCMNIFTCQGSEGPTKSTAEGCRELAGRKRGCNRCSSLSCWALSRKLIGGGTVCTTRVNQCCSPSPKPLSNSCQCVGSPHPHKSFAATDLGSLGFCKIMKYHILCGSLFWLLIKYFSLCGKAFIIVGGAGLWDGFRVKPYTWASSVSYCKWHWTRVDGVFSCPKVCLGQFFKSNKVLICCQLDEFCGLENRKLASV